MDKTEEYNISFLQSYCKIENSNQVYLLLGVARKKNNEGITNSQEVVFREVIRENSDIEKKYNRLKSQCENYRTKENNKLNFYIYVSVNARDLKKTYWNFMKEMFSLGETIQTEESLVKLGRVDKLWLSCLMKPCNKSGRGLFLLDIDTKEQDKINKIAMCLMDVGCPINKTIRLTKNGYHWVHEPFNRQKFENFIKRKCLDNVCSVKIDSLLFLESVN